MALAAVPPALVVLYVAGRSLQYAAAEKDPGLYVPATANAVVRARGLEAHFRRIEESLAWRVLQRKVLKDPTLRGGINGLLKSNKLPTLDDLEDERKVPVVSPALALEIAGRDGLIAFQVRDSFPAASGCAVVRLPWLYYLATPFGRFFVPTGTIGGATCLKFRLGGQDCFLAFAGALMIGGNDKALMEQALRRQGREEPTGRPIEGRILFDGSPAMVSIRRSLEDGGCFPYVKFDTVRGLSFSGDIQGAGLVLETVFEKAEACHPDVPPQAIRAWAPSSTSGMMVIDTSLHDLMARVRGLVGVPGPRDVGRRNVLQALDTLDNAGFSSNFLPRMENGMGVISGVQEDGGRVYPTFVLIVPSRDPKGAVEAMNEVIRKIAGKTGKTYFDMQPVEETRMYHWRWPEGLDYNDFLRPSYAAIKGAFVFGNNLGFTEAVIRAAAQGGGLEDAANFRKLSAWLKEQGMAVDPSPAGGFISPPLFKESLDGLLVHIAKQMVYFTQDGPMLRAEIDADLRAQGRQADEAEIGRMFNEATERKKRDKEDALRANLRVMDSLKWVAFDTSATPKGIAFRLAVELR
jgi:hypothetical protein